MNRLAIFVEGYTEAIFITRLIEEIAGKNKVEIEHREIRGGTTVRRTAKLIKATKASTGQDYFVLLFDCGGDDAVKTRILEEHTGLTNRGYSKIIGIRDVRPKFSHSDIPRLRTGLRTYIKTALCPVDFLLSIMEIEAWFLAEHNHFSKIDPLITLDAIKSNLHFDPANDDMQHRAFPSKDLNDCYGIAGKNYFKHQISNTVDALDYAYIYFEVSEKFADLKSLVAEVDTFLR